MITGDDAIPALTIRELSKADSVDICGFEPPFRAESAAKGETKLFRAAEEVSGFRTSGTIDGFPGERGALANEPAASLNNCSIGNNRWAWTIFSNPSSR